MLKLIRVDFGLSYAVVSLKTREPFSGIQIRHLITCIFPLMWLVGVITVVLVLRPSIANHTTPL